MKQIASHLLLLTLILSPLFAACASPQRATATPTAPAANATRAAPTPTPQPTDLLSTLATTAELATLTTALRATGLSETFKGAGPFTLFAPTDQAFAAVDQTTLDDQKRFLDVLRYHIAATKVLTTSLATSTTVATLLGEKLNIGKQGRTVKVNDANLVMLPIQATNGVIYVIDKVLLPTLNSANSAANSAKPTTISDLLATDPRFGPFVDALRATGVYTELQGAGPFTVFVPGREAFTRLPNSLVDSLFKGTSVWARILHYHIVPDRKLLAAGFSSKEIEQTLEGSTLVITTKGEVITVNDAKLIQTDIQAANGVIHVIDEVLVPPLD